ncbi:hypothetical protein BDZ45DRAFT_209022 [Acephala macrosclerotiorum]|nr:hypothetical protein BDZ45DRAFT_209022 [Acephala macrosclerotiorum]
MLPSCKEIHRSCKALRPSILRSHAGRYPLPIRGHHLHFAVHHDRPISVSFLDRWRGREKPSKEAVTIEGREEAYDLGYHRIRPSESFRQTCTSQVFSSSASQLSCGPAGTKGGRMTSDIALSARSKASGRLAYSRSFPSSQLPILQRARSNWRILTRSSADPSNAPGRASHDPAASNQPRATQSRRIRNVPTARGKLTRKLRRAIHLRYLGRSEAEARLRRREAFLRLAVMLQRGQAGSTASVSRAP